MLFINHRSFAGGVENEIGIVVSGFASEKPARCTNLQHAPPRVRLQSDELQNEGLGSPLSLSVYN